MRKNNSRNGNIVKICVVVTCVFAVLVAYYAGFSSGKDHVIYTQELSIDGEYLYANIDGEIHCYTIGEE